MDRFCWLMTKDNAEFRLVYRSWEVEDLIYEGWHCNQRDRAYWLELSSRGTRKVTSPTRRLVGWTRN